jgi:hypothetical protein
MEGEQRHTVDIRGYPEDFPVHSWVEYVFEHLTATTKRSSRSSDFAARAVRILSEADELMESCPRQSFVCSTAAIELCLVGKGEAIIDSLSRRAARLVIADASLRPVAANLFRRLYDIRSRIVHGDDMVVDPGAAAFMRYSASAIVYAFAGLGRALPRFGVVGGEKSLREYLDSDFESDGLAPGVHQPVYLQELAAGPKRVVDQLLSF